jgi:hypothetical protein
VVVNHDAADSSFLTASDGEEWAYDVAKCAHALQLAVVAHNDEVGGLHDGADICFVAFVDENLACPGNPLEEIREDVGGNDVDGS